MASQVVARHAGVLGGERAAPKDRGAEVRLLAPLRVRNYALLWGGNAFSLAGDQFQMVALAVLALDLTGSTAALGAVLGAQAIPRSALMLAGGVAADRFQPRTVLLTSNLLLGALVAGLTAVIATGHLATWHLFAYAIGSGTLTAFTIPAGQALIPALVPREQLRSANALNSLNFNLSSSVCPPLAGLLVAAAGVAPAFFVNTVSFLAAAGAVLAIRTGATRGPAQAGIARQFREGIAAARSDAAVWVAITSAAVFSLGFGGAVLVGLPALAKLSLGAGSEGIGVLFGAAGAGAVAGALLMGSLASVRRQGLVAGIALLLMGLSLAAVAAASSVAAAVPALVASGILRAVCANNYLTLVQSRAPAAARGRVMALLMLGVNGLAPLSLGLGGMLGALFGPRVLIACGGAVVALAGAYALSRREFRRAE